MMKKETQLLPICLMSHYKSKRQNWVIPKITLQDKHLGVSRMVEPALSISKRGSWQIPQKSKSWLLIVMEWIVHLSQVHIIQRAKSFKIKIFKLTLTHSRNRAAVQLRLHCCARLQSKASQDLDSSKLILQAVVFMEISRTVVARTNEMLVTTRACLRWSE